MEMRLDGRTALVTGSSAGIGAVVASELAAEGCRVLVHGRGAAAVDEHVGRIQRAGGRAEGVTGDLADADGTAALLDEVRDRGPVDILVANAGPFTEHRFDEMTDGDVTDALESNLLSFVRCVRALLPGMRERGWGRVIAVTTRGVVTPLPTMVEYSAAKAAVANLSGNLARTLVGSGVTANTISPGIILTPGMRRMFQDRADAAGDTRPWEQLEAEVISDYAGDAVARLGRPEDLAAAAVFLASPRADYVNGATLRVDGGLTGTLNP